MKVRDRIKSLRRVKASDLLPHPKNWRVHPERQQNAMRGVLAEIGIADAVIARELPSGELQLIDGHLRTDLLPDTKIPVLVVDLDASEAEKLMVLHDPLAAMAETDDELLSALLDDLQTESDALADLLEELAPELAAEPVEIVEDEAPHPTDELLAKWKVERGQVWEAGRHRLMCGDSTNADDVARLMDGEIASMVHADPPYGMGKEKDGIANDNLYREKLDAFQMAWWSAWRSSVADNGSAYVWGNAPDLWRLWYRGGLADSERMTMRNEIAWWKGDVESGRVGGMGQASADRRMYADLSERCLFFMIGEQGFNNNNYWEGWEPIRAALKADCDAMGWGADDIRRICGVGMYSHWFTESQWCFIPEEHYRKLQAAAQDHDAFKRDHDELKREHDELKREFYATRAYFDNTHDNMTDVWTFDRVRGEDRHGHATPKPVRLVARAIMSSSEVGDCVVVPFAGTCPEVIACEQLDRRCYGMEFEPSYVAVCLERMSNLGLTCKLQTPQRANRNGKKT